MICLFDFLLPLTPFQPHKIRSPMSYIFHGRVLHFKASAFHIVPICRWNFFMGEFLTSLVLFLSWCYAIARVLSSLPNYLQWNEKKVIMACLSLLQYSWPAISRALTSLHAIFLNCSKREPKHKRKTEQHRIGSQLYDTGLSTPRFFFRSFRPAFTFRSGGWILCFPNSRAFFSFRYVRIAQIR